MATIHLEHIGHSYDAAVYALEKTDIFFEDGKTYALLGPSGCGKTTMLNIISGLLYPSDGRVLVGGTDMTRTPTAKRNIAQVFQFPVIYQSKTVYENLAFPLLCRGWDKTRIAPRVAEIAELLGLSSRLGQSSRRLTADEKQLISLGRGLVRNDVSALLMDEPLTVIDPHMKFDLRRRIKQANDKTRHTVVYVTHDQNEAMTFADEILVMSAGRIVQKGTPQDLFENPCNRYVGNFIGSPGMNFLNVRCENDLLRWEGYPLRIERHLVGLSAEQSILVGIRPEHVRLAAVDEEGIPALVQGVQHQGSMSVVDVAVGSERLKFKVKSDIAMLGGEIRINLPSDKIRIYVNDALI
ncbi:ABC transporter ATP-binding protein [Rhizobium rosettiformans]|jgi:glycerol transport system ATP-binding protein|uniref:ABC transporter ATP-binding protein n=1 Tax=Rhizobium rosettiformans TaxID=1368430 RepID=UPI0028670E6F|nr:ABC transporter ATP-binding protein [Rhizobium rosettiformans]MDR7031187.1 glycerol transport system ATP-binding protein [Rhizobium rosettiformans]MDR7066752.1 glycerol transport system ATP-binding protein [Rhizobium rosettiformans]